MRVLWLVAGVVAPETAVARENREALAALVADFPRYDSSLIAMMLEDQGDDAAQVRFFLRVRNAACKP